MDTDIQHWEEDMINKSGEQKEREYSGGAIKECFT